MAETPETPSPASSYGAVDLSAHTDGPAGAPAQAGSDAQSAGTIDQPLIIDVTEETFDQTMATSMQVPVVLGLWATWCQPCKQLGPILEEVVTELGGRIQLAKIDIDANPQIVQAFQVQAVPTVIALVGGRPVPLFQGAQTKATIREVFDQLLAAAEQMGVTGRLTCADAPAEPPLSEEDQAIEAALDSGDLDQAIALIKKALVNNPAEKSRYETQLAQVELTKRLGDEPGDDTDPLALADQFIAHGNEAGAYQVLLDHIAATTGEDREPARARLVDLLRVGQDADAVRAARSRLSRLLF